MFSVRGAHLLLLLTRSSRSAPASPLLARLAGLTNTQPVCSLGSKAANLQSRRRR